MVDKRSRTKLPEDKQCIAMSFELPISSPSLPSMQVVLMLTSKSKTKMLVMLQLMILNASVQKMSGLKANYTGIVRQLKMARSMIKTSQQNRGLFCRLNTRKPSTLGFAMSELKSNWGGGFGLGSWAVISATSAVFLSVETWSINGSLDLVF